MSLRGSRLGCVANTWLYTCRRTDFTQVTAAPQHDATMAPVPPRFLECYLHLPTCFTAASGQSLFKSLDIVAPASLEGEDMHGKFAEDCFIRQGATCLWLTICCKSAAVLKRIALC